MVFQNEEFIELPFKKCDYKYSDFEAVKITKELIPLFTKACDYFYPFQNIPETFKRLYGVTGDCSTCRKEYSCCYHLILIGLLPIHIEGQIYNIYKINVRVGQWVVIGKGGYLEIMDEENFFENFNVKLDAITHGNKV